MPAASWLVTSHHQICKNTCLQQCFPTYAWNSMKFIHTHEGCCQWNKVASGCLFGQSKMIHDCTSSHCPQWTPLSCSVVCQLDDISSKGTDTCFFGVLWQTCSKSYYQRLWFESWVVSPLVFELDWDTSFHTSFMNLPIASDLLPSCLGHVSPENASCCTCFAEKLLSKRQVVSLKSGSGIALQRFHA